MAWATPVEYRRRFTPTHTELTSDLISNPTSLYNLNDASVRVYRTFDIAIPNGTREYIAWNAEVWDKASMWSSGAATRLIAPVEGVYLLSLKIGWDPNNVGRRGCGYQINGVDPDHDMQFNTAQNGKTKENASDLLYLKANQYVECFAYQSSGGNLDILGSNEGDSTATLTLKATPNRAPRWTKPRTWANGDVLTRHLLHTQWRDNLLNMRNFKGHGVKLSMSENRSIGAGQRTMLTWDVPQIQVGDIWRGGSQLYAPVAGWYMLLPIVEWRSESITSTGAIRGVGYKISGRETDFDLQMQSGTAAGVSTAGKALVRLEKDEWIEVFAFHDADQSLTINGDPDRTRVSMWLEAS